MITNYISLDCLALNLSLPKTYLRRLVKSGELPYVDTGNGRKRFKEDSVRAALDKIEQQAITPQRANVGHRSHQGSLLMGGD